MLVVVLKPSAKLLTENMYFTGLQFLSVIIGSFLNKCDTTQKRHGNIWLNFHDDQKSQKTEQLLIFAHPN